MLVTRGDLQQAWNETAARFDDMGDEPRASRETASVAPVEVVLEDRVEQRLTERAATFEAGELRYTFGTQAIRKFKIHEVQRMMGHRHITTTERYLHYAPDADGAAKLTELWGDRGDRDRGAPPSAPAKVIPLRPAA